MSNSVPKFQPVFAGALSDYVTGLAWSCENLLAACSAAGDVALCAGETLTVIKPPDGLSLSQVAFSANGQFLAAAGQGGEVWIWRLNQQSATLMTTLKNPGIWIDHLAWHPSKPELAIGLKHYVQIWDAVEQGVIATLDFAASSVLGLAWHPAGTCLAVGGYQGIQVWSEADWDDEPKHLELMSACVGLAWSGDGAFMAAANIDRTLSLWQWGDESPWAMRGFPGKVKQLVWSDVLGNHGAPVLASSCAEGIVVWQRNLDLGWESHVLDLHQQAVIAIAFQPDSMVLASAGSEGWICLWKQALEAVQILEGVRAGFSGLAWSRDGDLLAGGGQAGEVLVWQRFEDA